MSCALLATVPARVPAAPPEPLDEEFLEYLGACEGKDDNWTVVAKEKPGPEADPVKKPPAAPPPEQTPKPSEDRP